MARAIPLLRRNRKRTRVWLSGQIGGEDWQQEVRVSDLSEAGALVECAFPPPIDNLLNFCCGGIEVEARVAWSGNFCAGIAFLTPVDPETLARYIGPLLRVSAPRDYRPFGPEAAG